MLNFLLTTLVIISTCGSVFVMLMTPRDKVIKSTRVSAILVPILLISISLVLFLPASSASMLNDGINMLNDGDFLGAQQTFDVLKDQEMLLETEYAYAKQLYTRGNYQEAIELFKELGEYKNSKEYLQYASLFLQSLSPEAEQPDSFKIEREKAYSAAVQYYEAGQFLQAINCFKALEGFRDSYQMIQKCVVSAREEASRTISAGIKNATAIKNDGTVVFAGHNDSFDFSQWSDIVSISNLGVITAGLKSDGTVVTTGSYRVDVSDWSDIISVSVGERYIVGLKSDGTLIGAGHDLGDGQLQIGGWSNIVAIATGWRHTVGLDADGGIHITGYRSTSQLEEIKNNLSGWTNITAIAAGGGNSIGTGHTVGLRSDGTVVAVGDNTYGQCNVSNWTNIVAIAAGDWHTVGLCADGTVVSTRPNSSKYPNLYSAACDVENWSNIVEIDAGCGYTLGLCLDGTVVALGYNDYGQQKGTSTWENIKAP